MMSVKKNKHKDLLAKCATLVNIHGPDSDEVKAFVREHSEDSQFVELANLSRVLKKVLEIDREEHEQATPLNQEDAIPVN